MAEARIRTIEAWKGLVGEAPAAPALFAPDGVAITRADLDAASDRLVAEWSAQALPRRGLLVLNLPNGLEWMTVFLAALKYGCVVLPLDPGLEPERVRRVVERLRASALWDGLGLRRFESARARRFRNPELILGKFTSGSTGDPRAFFFSDSEMIADASQVMEGMGLRATDRNLGAIPWGHSYGLGNIVFPLLLKGMACCWTASVFPEDLAAACERCRATVFPTVPTFLRILAKSGVDAGRFESLRLVISAAAPLTPALSDEASRRFGWRPRNFYGSTETGGIAYDGSGRAIFSEGGVGRPLPGVEIQVDRGGRLRVCSAAVHRFENRCKPIDGRASFLCGDRGTVDESGRLKLRSRVGGMAKIGGRRVSLEEVKRALEASFGPGKAEVFTLEQSGESRLAAVLEGDLPEPTVRAKLRAEVPLRLRPKFVRCVAALPLTGRGKVDRAALRRLFGRPIR